MVLFNFILIMFESKIFGWRVRSLVRVVVFMVLIIRV